MLDKITDFMLSDTEGQIKDKIAVLSGTGEVKEKVNKDEFLSDKADNASQTANANENIFKSMSGNQDAIGTVCFVDDDGNAGVLTTLKDFIIAKDIPYTIALYAISPILDNVPEVLDLQNNYNVEIASHGYTHADMSALTEDQLIQDSKNILQLLRSKGFVVNNLMYPYGAYSNLSQKVLRKYYRSAFSTSASTHESLETFRPYRINRISFPTAGYTFDTYKAKVDGAYATNGLLVFTTHVWSLTVDEMQILSDLVDYIKSINMPIKTVNDALDYFMPIIESGLSTGNHFVLQRDGKVRSNYAKVKRMPENTYTGMSLISDFELGVITVSAINTANAVGLPNDISGFITTNRIQSAYGYNYQEVNQYYTDKTYRRYPDVAGAWGAWVEQLNSNSPTVIVASSTNADGSYVKYSDGTLICWGVVSKTGVGLTTAINGFYRNAASAWEIPFPSAFIDSAKTVVHFTGSGTLGILAGSATVATTAFSPLFLCTVSGAYDLTTRFKAVGRWK